MPYVIFAEHASRVRLENRGFANTDAEAFEYPGITFLGLVILLVLVGVGLAA